ncbi:acyl carrier protein [Enterobacter mori]|uniref:acyl carrier protein n=1 Tax=Enterobacter mori TaxID=539813 RepID=UPI001B8CBAF0|nr:acyl carrier protein [Enterobacter mori]MBS3049731.1 acyl carrier protein [Enterobacter mori]
MIKASNKNWLEQTIAAIRNLSLDGRELDMQSLLIVDLHIDSLEMLELVTAVELYTQLPLADKIWSTWQRLQDVLDYLNQTVPYSD